MDRYKPDQRFIRLNRGRRIAAPGEMKQLKPKVLSYSYIPASLIPYLITPFFFRDRAKCLQ